MRPAYYFNNDRLAVHACCLAQRACSGTCRSTLISDPQVGCGGRLPSLHDCIKML